MSPPSVSGTVTSDGSFVGNARSHGKAVATGFQTPKRAYSPDDTPRMSFGSPDGSVYFSPDGSRRNGNMSEPRNYAPRTAGQAAMQIPPPVFNLDLVAYEPKKPISQESLALQPMNVPTMIGEHQVPEKSQSDKGMSDKLRLLTNTLSGYPTLATALAPENFPFVESGKQVRPKNHGIVRLRNIPFATPQSEVIALFGRTSRILNDADEPVHIIMERMTGKTMDAYVEFCTFEDASKAVEKHQRNHREGRPSHIGQRIITVSLASQAELMQDLFPLAAGVTWNGVNPVFHPVNEHEPWKNFKGFVSEEEMTMLAKHAKVPNRTPFARACPQRPYECLISTLKKFPWHLTDRVSISQRYAVFRATWDLVEELTHRLARERETVSASPNAGKLSDQLLKRVITAAINCPGFTPLMKDDLSSFVHLSEENFRAAGVPPSAASWRHQYAIAPKVGVPFDVIEWYISVVRAQTQRDMMARPFTERTKFHELSTDTHWGFFWVELNYPFGQQFDDMTMAEAANMEFSALEKILARALPSY
ncbi:hypothetical protein CC79DRAFT_1367515 [Sarocladium strictum]